MAQACIQAERAGSEDPELERLVYRSTLEEAKPAASGEQWLRGPLAVADLRAKYGKLWIPSPRLGRWHENSSNDQSKEGSTDPNHARNQKSFEVGRVT